MSASDPLLRQKKGKTSSGFDPSITCGVLSFVSVVLAIAVYILFDGRKVPSAGLSHIVESCDSTYEYGNSPFASHTYCDSDTLEVMAWHIHTVFDGDDLDAVTAAYAIRQSFMDAMKCDIQACTHSHNNPGIGVTDICYFPTTFTETDFPLPSNAVWQSTNYAFYIPLIHLTTVQQWWTDNGDETYYGWALHPVTGCQLRDHSTSVVTSPNFEPQIVLNNLFCCHTGPAKCACDIVQLEVTSEDACLTLDSDASLQSFSLQTCEKPTVYGFGSWRVMEYSVDEQWYQMENFGGCSDRNPVSTYLCLGVDLSVDSDNVCKEGNQLSVMDCSVEAIGSGESDSEWVSQRTNIQLDEDSGKLVMTGCTDDDLCVALNSDDDTVSLVVTACSSATSFTRHFFP